MSLIIIILVSFIQYYCNKLTKIVIIKDIYVLKNYASIPLKNCLIISIFLEFENLI